MNVVRLTATAADPATAAGGDFTVLVEHVPATGARVAVRAVTRAVLTAQDRADLHWYLEEYLLQTYPPNDRIAARIEQRMRDLGEELFRDLFQANEDARDLWATLRRELPATRVEIDADIAAGTAIPWELLRDPRLAAPLALEAAAFVRVQSQNAVRADSPTLKAGDKLRVLVAICRPDGGDDVPFRSVASRILKSVTAADRQRIELTVLRPPTFERLGQELRRAKDAGAPYHILHFDGHGMYEDLHEAAPGGGGGGFSRLWMGKFARPGKHGYLCFEDDGQSGNFRPVSGEELGNLLRQTAVPVLLLNACRSAHSDATSSDGGRSDGGSQAEQVRAFGSLAQEVVNAGVAGVLAMRYNVWVVTAAQYVEALYSGLAGGKSLAAAATDARRNLFEQPGRRIAGDGVDLQDWMVPAVFEAAAVTLLPAAKKKRKTADGDAPLSFGGGESSGWRGSDEQLPPPPDIGFIGRDETVLALDRGFDKHRTVLLHAYAGAGKTSTAAEFARWYRDTNGLGGGLGDDGIVLFDSFERYGYDATLPGLLGKLGRLFEPALRQGGIEWQALDDGRRRALALDLLRQVPVLWIWDNVEPVAGFPAGAPSDWSAEEQRDLRDFLRAVATGPGKGRILLTSRRDETGWLGQIPARVTAPPLRMADRLAMAEKLAERHGRQVGFAWVLMPLLDYSQGNPMTLTVLVGQALRDGLGTPEQVEAYVAKLRSGEAGFDDDESQGRSRSLGASLAYGFQAAFTEEERRLLSLLHLFQGSVRIDALLLMGHKDNPGAKNLSINLTGNEWKILLDRAVEIGLLERNEQNRYRSHPAVCWFMKNDFEHFWEGDRDTKGIKLAYCISMGEISTSICNSFIFNPGKNNSYNFSDDEPNIIFAIHEAISNNWVDIVISLMQGLGIVMKKQCRWETLQSFVERVMPLILNKDGTPKEGQERNISFWLEHASELSWFRHDYERYRELISYKLAIDRNIMHSEGKRTFYEAHNYAVSLTKFSTVLIKLNDEEAIEHLNEALEVCSINNDKAQAAIVAHNLGLAYKNISEIVDTSQAARWYRISLLLRDESDFAGRAACHAQLGMIAYQTSMDLEEAEDEQEVKYLITAMNEYSESLRLLPENAIDDRSICYMMLGNIHRGLIKYRKDSLDDSLKYYRISLEISESIGDVYRTSSIRHNIAATLCLADDYESARLFIEEAIRGFHACGADTSDMIGRSKKLKSKIDKKLYESSP